MNGNNLPFYMILKMGRHIFQLLIFNRCKSLTTKSSLSFIPHVSQIRVHSLFSCQSISSWLRVLEPAFTNSILIRPHSSLFASKSLLCIAHRPQILVILWTKIALLSIILSQILRNHLPLILWSDGNEWWWINNKAQVSQPLYWHSSTSLFFLYSLQSSWELTSKNLNLNSSMLATGHYIWVWIGQRRI